MDIPLGEIRHFDVQTSDPETGAAMDATAIDYDVFEEDTDTAILSSETLTKRGAFTGQYRGSINCSTGNGFEIGKWYSVYVDGTVNGISAKAMIMNFRIVPTEISAGVPDVNATYIKDVDALNLALSIAGIIGGAATGTPTTTSMNTDLTGYESGELVGGTVIWTGGTASGQRAEITSYTLTNGVVGYAAITTAPIATDPFVIV